jgi:SAM-dependent methyltransferase
MEQSRQRKEQWSKAAQVWDNLGTPLRPSPGDVRIFANSLSELGANGTKPLRALVLGVTPELYHLPWPTGSTVRAVDHSQAMIDYVWPGSPDSVLCADWVSMPYEAGSMDVALCDGGMSLLHYPDTHRSLAKRLSEVLAPGGFLIMRLFEPPKVRERPEAVIEDLNAGRILNTNCLKLRLGMALQPDALTGVRVHDVWAYLNAREPSWEALAARLDWPVAQLKVIDVYRDSPARYHFLTAEQVLEVFREGSNSAFEQHRIERPDYVMGGQCPILTLRRV